MNHEHDRPSPTAPPIPDVPLRVELVFELPGTPEQVWDAIATAKGMSAWFLPTEMEEREGGALTIHMGETDSEGTVTAWEPPRRLVYEEDWATLIGRSGAPVTPLVSEFVVEARSGGTCVLRVVSSAYGTGADWENEFIEDMAKNWAPSFDTLRIYLTDFAGQEASTLEASARLRGDADGVLAALRRELGGAQPGDPVRARDLEGEIHRIDPAGLFVRVRDPHPGYLSLYAFDGQDDDRVTAGVNVWLFSPAATDYLRRERDAWQSWLESLAVTTP